MSNSTAGVMASPLSTRAAALERRRALSRNGAAALQGKKSSSPSPGARMNSSGKSLSRAHREALSQRANVDSKTDTKMSADDAVAPTNSSLPREEVVEPKSIATSQNCGCGSNHTAEDSKTDTGQYYSLEQNDHASVVQPATSMRYRPLSDALAGLSGREAARVYREVLCRQGRGSRLACKPSGRIRLKPSVPAKVEQGTTLRGTPVTGTQVERSVVVTGTESGSCRPITGTEYIGSEQYDMLCAATPEPAPPKVEVGRTARGQSVSGVGMGRSVKITGDEYGSCKIVTGTEYLSADRFESFCATRPFQPSAKVNVATTEGGQRVSGTEVGRVAKVTGGESGSQRQLTGSQYYQPESPDGLIRNGSGAPHKVSVMNTLHDRVVTGTETVPGDRVTGAERGTCVTVTGTETTGLEQYQACNRKPLPGPEKVNVMHTWHDQPVSGTSVERSSKVTGDEYGSCQPVTGKEYVGPDQFAEFCAPDLQGVSKTLMGEHSGVSDVVTTGTSLGPDSKVTGSSRGENVILSGTPYGGTRGRARQAGKTWSPLTYGPVRDTPHSTEASHEVVAVRGDFSVTTPARAARDRSVSRITGTAYGVTGSRITGPVNLAAGLVSGTPEFRYRDDAYSAAQIEPIPETPRSRLTGDGREGGFTITGAAWGRTESITGTEGASTRRNPTLRGQRGNESGTSQTKDRIRPATSVIQVTGSSGSDAQGPSVTYSGGTRG